MALPGLGSLDEALEGGATPGELVEGSALSSGGDLGRLASVREGSTRVQDVGSQLVARAMAAVDLGTARRHGPGADPGTGSDSAGERWLDLCAGPGGKAALLGALARQRGATLLANEPAPHRAKLVRQALSAVPRDAWEVRTGDGRDVGAEQPESFDRVLVDVPCTGLGALRRRPESRWRRTPKDLADLGPLQRELLNSALDAVKPGGVVAYVTCSPHPAETTAVVSDALRKREDLELLDAGAVLDGVSLTGHLEAGHELTAQLWPHVHQHRRHVPGPHPQEGLTSHRYCGHSSDTPSRRPAKYEREGTPWPSAASTRASSPPTSSTSRPSCAASATPTPCTWTSWTTTSCPT